MLRRLSVGLLASAIAIAPLPTKAQDGTAEDLGVMSISLKDVVKPTIGFQGALQGAGTPNQAGIGGFLPLSVGENSIWFLDALVNAHFGDRDGYSSIINTDVAGTTVSTSSRFGYRFLNGDRTWMYGLNAGYDSRPMNTGRTDTGIKVSGTKNSAFFQQVAFDAEAVSKQWNINVYALVPFGDTQQRLNWFYEGGALDTFGLNVGYRVAPKLISSIGYYYQSGDHGSADGSGFLGELKYEVNNSMAAKLNISYDRAFDTRATAAIEFRFRTSTNDAIDAQKDVVIASLTSTPRNRNIRVHDTIVSVDKCWKYKSNGTTLSNSVESCDSTSTGYESATDAEYTKDKAYESCTKKAGAFSYSETMKTSIKSGETMKYEYYCQINS